MTISPGRQLPCCSYPRSAEAKIPGSRSGLGAAVNAVSRDIVRSPVRLVTKYGGFGEIEGEPAAWQYTRYCACAEEVLRAALAYEATPPLVDLAALVRFLVAAIDGLVIQYEVHHEAEQSRVDVENVITAVTALAGRAPRLRG